MDFRLFFLCGLHTIVLEIDFQQNKHIMEKFDPLVTKQFGRPTDHLGGLLGRLGRPGDLLFYTLSCYGPDSDLPESPPRTGTWIA